MAGYGGAPFGGSSYGGGSAFDLVAIYAPTAQAIRVTFAAPYRAARDRAVTDGLERSNYTLTVVSGTSEPPPRILSVSPISATVIELRLAGELEGTATTYRLTVAPSVQSAGGTPIGVGSATFLGLTTDRTDRGGKAHSGFLSMTALTDLRFPFAVTAEGDVALSEDLDTLRKLILRRLTTAKGGFVHLPDYGLAAPHARLVTPEWLRSLPRAIREQVLLEPEVESVEVDVQHLVGRSVVLVTLEIVLRRGLGGFRMSASTKVP